MIELTMQDLAEDIRGISAEATVMVVDLDGTLVRTDTMHEAVLGLALRDPAELLRILPHAGGPKAAFKRALSERQIVDPALLPYNDVVVEAVTRARAEGRRTALVSASDQRQVDAVAAHLGIFDEAFGTDGATNLKGPEKAAFLVERYGPGGFEYWGDSAADLDIWPVASGGAVVGASEKTERRAIEASGGLIRIKGIPKRAAWLKALRPHQWAKNALLFLPLLAAHDLSQLPFALLAFVAFSMAASSVYVLNDLLDLPSDRAHPRKRSRPFASGDLTASEGVLGATGLLSLALLVAFLAVGSGFAVVLLVYLVTTFAYSMALKRKPILDILTLAGLYTIRIYAGALATSLSLSPWMLGFSIFFFLSLAAVKRQAELVEIAESGRSMSGRGYVAGDLPIIQTLAVSAGMAANLVLAIYISSSAVQRLYTKPDLLWFVCPMLLYWSMRMVMKTHRGQMTDDPVVFAVTEKVSVVVLGLCACVILGAATL